MEIYLVRHGQTDFNLKQIVQGRGIDSVLNEEGRRQARAFFDTYKDIPFDAVITSALKRTQQTVAEFIQLGLPHFAMPELDEIDWGIYEGIAHDIEMHQRYLDIIDKWRGGDLNIKMEGGESARDLYLRQAPFFEMLKSADYDRLLVCSHGRSIRALLCTMTKTPLQYMDDFPHMNTSLYKLKYENDIFHIELFNNTDHLNESI